MLDLISTTLITLAVLSGSLAVVLDGDKAILSLVSMGLFLGLTVAELGSPLLGALKIAVITGIGAFLYFYGRWRP